MYSVTQKVVLSKKQINMGSCYKETTTHRNVTSAAILICHLVWVPILFIMHEPMTAQTANTKLYGILFIMHEPMTAQTANTKLYGHRITFRTGLINPD
ncbi:hypothetical protein PRUPE_5G123900 [Prunus persica]|uniref:Uncharacterized protein n=1 Tax=Prunus persica TaxID=3760 RepID=A0A251P7F0_PRUPE|nr:hypothetical protein PRUPE_5G123900 [Prunus persica]